MTKHNKFRFALVMAALAGLLTSCTQSNKSPQEAALAADTALVADTLPVYNFTDALLDTLRLDNLIESVKYVPLETIDDALLEDRNLYAYKIGDKYVVTSGENERLKVKVFDENGKFLKNGFVCGRGHLEMPLPYSHFVDEIAGRVIINGMDKVLIFNVNTFKTDVYFTNLRGEHNIFRIYPLGTNTYAGLDVPQDEPETDKAGFPYLFLLDSSFNIVDALRYDKDEERRGLLPPEGKDAKYSMLKESWQLSQIQNGLLFKQIYNDTIFFISPDFKQEPAFVLNRGRDLIPTFAERKQSYKTQFDKMCLTNVFESKDYLFLFYRRMEYKLAIWHKSSSQMLLQSNSYDIPVSFDGFSGTVKAMQALHGNTIISAIPAGNLHNVLPGLKEDDNPVLVEIKLKDSYNPVQ